MTSSITGRSLPESGFRLHQTTGTVDPDAVAQVLRGELAAYRVRHYLSAEDCLLIRKNFWAPGTRRTPRYGEGEDGVEGYLIGASHIETTTDEYLDAVQRAEPDLRNLYAGTTDPATALCRSLPDLGVVQSARAAVHNGRAAGGSKAICWNQTGEYLLQPHEDLAQLADPLQADFEIQQIDRVMAVNLYPRTRPGTGALKLWNVEPDDRARARLGLECSGFPYPLEPLAEHASLVVPVETGDLCLIDGNLVHGVLRGPGCSGQRLLLTCFTGLTGAGELLWWT